MNELMIKEKCNELFFFNVFINKMNCPKGSILSNHECKELCNEPIYIEKDGICTIDYLYIIATPVVIVLTTMFVLYLLWSRTDSIVNLTENIVSSDFDQRFFQTIILIMVCILALYISYMVYESRYTTKADLVCFDYYGKKIYFDKNTTPMSKMIADIQSTFQIDLSKYIISESPTGKDPIQNFSSFDPMFLKKYFYILYRPQMS